MRIRICNCIDNNPIREFDIDQSNLTIIELLEHSLQRLNLQNLKDNVTVFSDGQEVPCDLWSVFKLSKTKCLKFVIKPQDFFSIAMIIIALAVAVYTMSMLKKLKTDDKKQESGSSIYDPNAQGNKAKLEDPIPEQFGLVKAFPDYISDKHYFYVNNVRYMSMLLCQGVGYYDWSLDQMYIGATPISSYVGSDIDVLVADPNQDISSHDAHRCWYNSTEVTMSGKEVPATESNSRKRGEIVSATLTLNGLVATSNSDLHLSSGDMIRLYNLQGQDRTINLTEIEVMPSSVRCYASSIPSNLNLALGWKVALTVRNGGSSETYPLTLINYGTDTNKGKFIDVNFVNLTITENTSATLVLKSFVYNDSNLESSHVLDNGFYEVQAVNGTSYTLLAKDKNGITYRTTSGWGGFSANRTSSAEIELVETASTLSNAKSNIAGYYRACPIGATSRYYEVDFSFPSGLYHLSDKGDYENRTATILLEWKIAGSTDAPQSMTKVYTKNSPDAFGETISIDVGDSNNAYEFRVTNLSEYTTDSQDVQTFLWNGLKCLISEDTHYPDVTVIAITVRGSQSLSELSDNQISTLWTRRLANLNDVKTTTYQDVVVNGFDTFNYSAPEMYDLIMANSWYPAYWKVPKNFMWINNEGYFRRYIKMQNWRDNGENDQTGWSPYGATFWFTNERLINSREATIIQYQQVIDNLPVAGTMDKDSSYISDHRDYRYRPNTVNAEKGNLQFWFEANNYSERTNLGRTYNGFCLCLFDKYKSSDGVEYYEYRLYAPVSGGGDGLGTLISSYLIETAFFISQGGDMAHSIRIEHTRAYIKIWINPHENREDGSQGHARLIFNVTADDYPQIAIHFGQYIGFMKGGTYASSGYFWTWYIGKLSIQYPTRKTITVANQSATTGEDKEINRSLSAPIKYICENSKFGKIYDEQNLMQLDQMWNTAGLNFDYRFDKSTTVLEAIKQCMQVGYTEPIIDGNKIKGTYRSENAYVEQMFTANNMTGEPKITYNFITPTDNDEADITYMNPQNWKQDEVYVDIDKSTNESSVYNYQNSLNTEKVEVLAVTDVNKAIKLGARRLREIMYQRKQIDFDCEFDALNCNYGSLIAVALPQDLNAYSGYVVDYDSNTLICELSDTVPSDVSLIYIRRYDGTVQQINCTYIDNTHVQLLSAIDFNLRSNVQLDPLHYAIGKIEKYWVTSIKPSDKKCSVTAINYDARVFVDDPFEPEPEPEPTGLNLNGAELYQYILDHTGHNLQGTWETTEQNQLKVTGTNVNGSYVVFSELGALNDFVLEWEMTVLSRGRINSGISPILLTDPTGSSIEGWNNGTITNAKFVYFMCDCTDNNNGNVGTLKSISDNGSMSNVNSSTGSFTVGTKYTYKLVRADGYLRLYQDNNLISEYQETTYADTPFYLGWYMWWGGTNPAFQANFIIDSYKIELTE